MVGSSATKLVECTQVQPSTFDHTQRFFSSKSRTVHQHCLNWFAEGRSSHDKTKLYLGKSHRALIIAVDEEEENLEEKEDDDDIKDDKIRMGMRRIGVRIRVDRRIGMMVMMSLRRKI